MILYGGVQEVICEKSSLTWFYWSSGAPVSPSGRQWERRKGMMRELRHVQRQSLLESPRDSLCVQRRSGHSDWLDSREPGSAKIWIVPGPEPESSFGYMTSVSFVSFYDEANQSLRCWRKLNQHQAQHSEPRHTVKQSVQLQDIGSHALYKDQTSNCCGPTFQSHDA
jgi:hypothetical protein